MDERENKLIRYLKKIYYQHLLTAALLIAVGLVLVFFPDNSARIACYIANTVLLIWGILQIVLYCVHGQRGIKGGSLVGGTVAVCAAILLFVHPDILEQLITIAFGIALVADGMVKLQKSIGLLKTKSSSGYIILTAALISIALGVIALFAPFGMRTLIIFLGISLIADGAFDILTSLFLFLKNKQNEKTATKNPAYHEVKEDDPDVGT